MPSEIKIGRLKITLPVTVGFVALGFAWACIANYGKGSTPEGYTTISFWFMVLAGVWLLHDLGTRFESVLDRMWSRGAIKLSEKELQQFKAEIEAKGNFAALMGGVTLFVLMIVFYVTAYDTSRGMPSPSLLIQYAFEAGANVIVGLYMGRTIVQSSLGVLLQKRRFNISIMRGHPDGAAGMSPIGGLFLRQAAVTLMPAIYFVVWWALMTGDGISDSGLFDETSWNDFREHWSGIYLSLFITMMFIQFTGFFGPMWVFHQQMKKQKAGQLVFADNLTSRMDAIRSQLEQETDEATVKSLKAQLAHMTELYKDVESLPIWPVSTQVRRKFAIRNTLVLLPVIIKIYEFAAKEFFDRS